jgi:hypothetical protein
MSMSMMFKGLLGSALLFSGVAWAADSVVIAEFSSGVDAKGVPKGWQIKEKSGKADFTVIKEGANSVFKMKSANTSFSLQKEVNIDLKRYPVLTWKWKVTKLPTGGDFRKSGTDDQAAQLFLAFSKTQAIVYIWDTTAPQGVTGNASAPFFMTIKAVVVRSGAAELGKWIVESRNVYEDYKKFFGKEPPPVTGVRLQINSQHTGTSAESYFGDVAFKKP